MSNRRTHRRIARDTARLAWAVPEVVAHRTMQMWLAGHSPSQRDRMEFHRMSAEKIAAFYESWTAMTLAIMRAGSQAAFSWPGMGVSVFAAGLAPIRRRAVANARRLRRTRA